MPSQRRPESDGPTFGPRPAADRGPATNRPDPRTAYANPRPADINNRLNPDSHNQTPKPDTTPRPDLGNRLNPNNQNTTPSKPDSAPRPDLGNRLNPNNQNTTPSKADSAPRPDLGHRLDPNGQNTTPSKPDSTPRPDIGNRLDPTGDNSRPDAPRSHDDGKPDINNRLDPEGHNTHRPGTDDTTPPFRPTSEDRPKGSPGGLDDPSPADNRHINDAVPRNPDGTPTRHPDPNEGNWPGAVNGTDPNAPGRTNNCVDVALAMVDTYSGHPTAAASRTPDHDANGNPSDRGERGGRDRIENALGARFNDMGNGDQAYRRLEDTLRNSGHGSQAVIITTDKDGRSHAWNAVNHNGTITYIDAQTGQRSNQPLHNGDNGVFAIPLDPNRTPTTPDHHTTDPTHNPDHDRRAPEEAAGTDPNDAQADDSDQKPDEQTDEADEEVDRRITELEAQGHAPGRHVKPDAVVLQRRLGDTVENDDGSPKLYTEASANSGHVKSENFIDPMTGTNVDHDTGGPHRCGPYATKYKDPADLVAVDDYGRAYIEQHGTPPPVDLPIKDIFGDEGHSKFEGYYKDPNNPSDYLPVDFEGGTIKVVYVADGNGGYRMLTSYASPAPGRHP